MTDDLKQVGKYIGKTGRDADRALKRAYPIQPRLERVRDVFDTSLPFEMNFVTTPNDERVLLDLFFKLPPPSRGCKVGCIHTKCEDFTFEAGGNHAVTVANPYKSGSVSVFVNGNKLPTSQVSEVSPEAGEVFFQGTDGPDIVAVCYIYLVDCTSEGTVFPNCPAINPPFIGSILLFSDRMDRTPGIETYGGLGFWSTFNTFPGTPISVPNTGGGLSIFTSRVFYLEQGYAASPPFELVMAIDLTNSTALWFISASIGNTAFMVDSKGLITLQYAESAYSTNPIDVLSTASLTREIYGYVDTTNLKTKVYTKFYYDGTIYQVKIWRQDSEEPDTWIQFIPTTFPVSGWVVEELSPFNVAGTIIRGSGGAYLTAVELWGTQINEYGYWGLGGDSNGKNWGRAINHHIDPDPGLIYNGPDSDVLTEVNLGTNLSIQTFHPTYQLGWAFQQFNPELGVAHFGSALQRTVSVRATGNSQTAKISGDIIVYESDSHALLGSTINNVNVAINAYNYGDGEPSFINDIIGGTVLQTVNCPFNTWVPFEVEIPVTFSGDFQWGVNIVETGYEIAPQLGTHSGTLFLARGYSLLTDMRRLNLQTTVIPIGGATPFCPGGALSERCTVLSDGLIGPTYDYFYTGSFNDTYFTSANGVTWALSQGLSTRIELNGSYRTLFKAAGITDAESGGRQGWENGYNYGAVSMTGSSSFISTSSPLSCGWASMTFKFKYSGLGNPWVPTSVRSGWESGIGVTFTPTGGLSVGDFSVVVTKTGTSYRLGDATDIAYRFLADTTYNVKVELTDFYRLKIWQTGTLEPVVWLREKPRAPYIGSTLTVAGSYLRYVNDDFYWDVSDILITPIDTVY